MRIGRQSQAKPSKYFTGPTDESAFGSRCHKIDSTTVYFLRPPHSHHSDRSWIVAPAKTADRNDRLTLHHPLNLKHQVWKLLRYLDFSKFHPSTLAVSHYVGINVDQLLVVPPTKSNLNNINDDNLHLCTLLALYNGGRLRGCPPYHKAAEEGGSSPWVKLLHASKFDDIIFYNGEIFVFDRQGVMYLINNNRSSRKISIGKTLITHPVCPGPGSGRFGWRKRVVVDGKKLYLIVRTEEKLFQVYGVIKFKNMFNCYKVREFEGRKVLFMARDNYFFMPALSKFPGREYKNCIVFSEVAFPEYGNDCWDFTKDGIAIFRLTDNTFAREGKSAAFPEIHWWPPSWIFEASSVSADEFQSHPSSESPSQTESEPDEDEGLDSNSRNEKHGEVQSDSKDSNSTDEDSNANTEDGASLQEDVSPSTDTGNSGKASLCAAEEVIRTLLSMNGGNGATDKETSRKNITQSVLRAYISSTTKGHINDSGTTEFEGFDIRSNLVPTLEKIWRKHGNIVENNIIHNGDIVAKALESLATMVQILEDNSAQSLTDLQADYLSYTLSDLRCMSFKVGWLVCFVDKAVQLHKSKPLVDKIAKLVVEEMKLKKEIAKVSKMIPFYGQVKFDEPLGVGLT